MVKKELFEKIDEALNKPELWGVSACRIFLKEPEYKNFEFSLWMCSGFDSFSICKPYEVKFDFWQKIKLWRRAKRIHLNLLKQAELERTNIEQDYVLKVFF